MWLNMVVTWSMVTYGWHRVFLYFSHRISSQTEASNDRPGQGQALGASVDRTKATRSLKYVPFTMLRICVISRRAARR
jgi:hypothetical protein